MTRPSSGLLELLAEHGIPEKGVRLYLAACRSGPQTASELARLCAVDRVEAYRVIQQLTEAGLLSATGSRPRRFAALPPDELVDRWIRHAADRLKQLEQDREKILSDWEERRTEVEEGDPRRFAVLEGRGTIQRFLKKRVGTAERQVLVCASGPWLTVQIDGGLDRSLKDAAQRGVKVRVVTEVFPTNLAEAKHFAGFSELRHSSAPVTSRTVVIDHQGALVYVSGDEGLGTTGADQVALWSASPAFVQLARDYHKRLWGPGSRAEERFVEIESPPAAVLPVVAGRESAPFQRLKEIAKLGMRASGVREFQLDLPEFAEGLARQLGRAIAKEVEGRTPAEVAHSLGRYYATHTMGRLAVVKDRPLTIQVTGCFACTSDSPELGRVICPQLLRAVLESHLGQHWDVSKPDPTKHAARGCVFTATSA
jgi:sugar-specific transcriptional regulator TrmB